jgi:hypothetical protein
MLWTNKLGGHYVSVTFVVAILALLHFSGTFEVLLTQVERPSGLETWSWKVYLKFIVPRNDR